jgi:hypothetical protein
MPTPILSGGAGSPLGAATLHPSVTVEDMTAPLFADEGGQKTWRTRPLRTGRLTPQLGGCFPLHCCH